MRAFKHQVGNVAKEGAHLVVRVLALKKVVVAAMVRQIAGRVAAKMITSRVQIAQNAAIAGIQQTNQMVLAVLIVALPSRKVAVSSNLINLRKIISKATSREAIEPEMINLPETISLNGKLQKRVNFKINSKANDPVMIGLAVRSSKRISQKGLIKNAPLRGSVHVQSVTLREAHGGNAHAQIGHMQKGQTEISLAAIMDHLKVALPMIASQEARASRSVAIAARVVAALNGQHIKKHLKAAPSAQQMAAS